MDIAIQTLQVHRTFYVEGAELHLCDLDPKVKVIGQKASICDGVPSTSALVSIFKPITCRVFYPDNFLEHLFTYTPVISNDGHSKYRPGWPNINSAFSKLNFILKHISFVSIERMNDQFTRCNSFVAVK